MSHRTRLAVALVLGALVTGTVMAAEPQVAPGTPLPGAVLPDGLGVNIHFTDPRPGELEQLAAGGFTWVRMDFTWQGTERAAGAYDFAAYDRLLAALDGKHLRPVFILDYGNPLYDGGLSPCTDAGRAAFCRWTAAAVTHFRGRGVIWEMWNEPNGDFWKPRVKVEDYVALARAVGPAIRAAAPGELYVGPATSTIDLRFLEACFQGGMLQWWDAVSVHPYRQTAPETAGVEYARLRALIQRYAPAGRRVPILSGEWGYSSAWEGIDEALQGRYLARQWLTDIAAEVPLSIWYDWHEDGTDPKEGEHHFGTVRHAYTALAVGAPAESGPYAPKPAYQAARALTGALRGFTYCRRLALGRSDDYALLFAQGERVVVVAWTSARTAHEVLIPASAGAIAVTDHLGAPRTSLVAGPHGVTVTLDGGPQYLAPVQPNDLLRVAAACPRLPPELRVHAPATLTVPLPITNPLPRSLTLAVDAGAGGPSARLALPPGGTTQEQLSWPVALREDAPLRLVWTVADLGTFAEDGRIVPTNPLDLEVLPVRSLDAASRLPVRIANTGGDACAGTISLLEADGLNALCAVPYAFTAGQTEQIVSLPLSKPPAGGWRAGVVAHDGQRLVRTVAAQRFTALPWGGADAGALATGWEVQPDGDPKVGSTQVLAPAEDALTGSALTLDYQCGAGWKFLRIVPRNDALRALPGSPRALGLWLRGDGSGNHARLRLTDSTGQTHQPGGERIQWTGWRFVRFALDEPGAHWGGANDGVLHYPLRLDTLLLIDQADPAHPSQGVIGIAAPTLME